MRQHDGTRPGHTKIGALVKHPTQRGMLTLCAGSRHARRQDPTQHGMLEGNVRDSSLAVRVGKEPAMTGYARRRDSCG
jgi:hypothetical protein